MVYNETFQLFIFESTVTKELCYWLLLGIKNQINSFTSQEIL